MAGSRFDSPPLLLLLLLCLGPATFSDGLLYPRDSESRETKELNGVWNFRADDSADRNAGFEQKWYLNWLVSTGPVMPMPVPASYNDITTDRNMRDFVGWVWYDREFFVSSDWSTKRVVLRFDSAHYNAVVWVNGQLAMGHSGGHLPFEAAVNDMVAFGSSNRVTVAVNNTLLPTTLPPGSLSFHLNSTKYPAGYFTQNLQMDFFNYAGIHRSVRLYTTPKAYVADITINTAILPDDTTGLVDYEVTVDGDISSEIDVSIDIEDRSSSQVARSSLLAANVQIPYAHLWWPYTMTDEDPGYQYTFKVTITSVYGTDVYRQKFGIRTVKVTNTAWLINNKPFYCHGVDKHEDSIIRGKGLDYPLIVRDFSLLKWLGVNCFRTSHYPYAEELMDLADDMGIAVIDESPGVGIQDVNLGPDSLQHHLTVMGEMITRDKNRPSVIMWSLANEPQTVSSKAPAYFKTLADFVRKTDSSRPLTVVIGPPVNPSVPVFVDIVCLNRYYGWYSDIGHTEVITQQLLVEMAQWFANYSKPILISEYGAETIPGLHSLPSLTFTEEYQTEFMSEYHKGFDLLIPQYLVGELVWNFADFMTVQDKSRVLGNHKGLFTRERQPKPSAFLIKERYSILQDRFRQQRP